MMNRYVLLSLLLGLLTIAGGGCSNHVTQQQAESSLYANFQTVVARAPQEGYTPYWLGTSFSAGGLDFRGPFTSVIGHDVPGGGVSTDYDARVGENGGASLNVTSYSPTAWARVPGRFRTLPGHAIRLLGREASYITLGDHVRTVNTVAVVIPFDSTMVVVNVNSLGSAHAPTPGPDLNPLIDEQTLLAVLQHLRPYPQ